MLNNIRNCIILLVPSASSIEITLSNKYLHFRFTECKLNDQVILRVLRENGKELNLQMTVQCLIL